VRNIVFLTADVHYTAAHYCDPDKAAFNDFDPFWRGQHLFSRRAAARHPHPQTTGHMTEAPRRRRRPSRSATRHASGVLQKAFDDRRPPRSGLVV
jgi:hypothetical protein